MSWSVPGSLCPPDSRCYGKVKAVRQYRTTKETVWSWFDLGWERQVLENEKRMKYKNKIKWFQRQNTKGHSRNRKNTEWLRVLTSCTWLLRASCTAAAFDSWGRFKSGNPGVWVGKRQTLMSLQKLSKWVFLQGRHVVNRRVRKIPGGTWRWRGGCARNGWIVTTVGFSYLPNAFRKS